MRSLSPRSAPVAPWVSGGWSPGCARGAGPTAASCAARPARQSPATRRESRTGVSRSAPSHRRCGPQPSPRVVTEDIVLRASNGPDRRGCSITERRQCARSPQPADVTGRVVCSAARATWSPNRSTYPTCITDEPSQRRITVLRSRRLAHARLPARPCRSPGDRSHQARSESARSTEPSRSSTSAMTYAGRSLTVVNWASPASCRIVPRSPRMRLRMIRSRNSSTSSSS
jgi:hypothetical protein